MNHIGEHATNPTTPRDSVLVKLAPAPPPEAGATLTLTVSSNAPAAAVGGICLSLDRWRAGAWEAQWNLQDGSEPSKVVDGELTCPAIGRRLPTRLTLTLPSELDSGLWRLGYGWLTPVPEGSGSTAADTIASYVFEVP